MDDEEDIPLVVPGQICYDELEYPEPVEEQLPDVVLDGQIGISEIKSEQISQKPKNIDMQKVEKKQASAYEQHSNQKDDIDNTKDDVLQVEHNYIKEDNVKKHEEIENNNSNGEGTKGLIFKSLEDVLHDSMIPYTEHVVMDRALPRVEDGLKPVQRRILYSMLELGLEPDKPYRKSARIVGDCMGKYHPHGDSSVYDAMVRMAQPFSMSEVLVDGHGNFGSIDGDSAAAMRYTEARLAPLAMELLRDIDKNTVHFSLNFDDTLKEPDMLPGRFPNLLVNGASGIAVGVATNIPPHNFQEVCDGVIAYINKPTIKLEEMMRYIKAPDFPTGGQLIVGEDLVNAYRTGKGKVTIRATVNIETDGDKQSIVITSLPYQTNKVALLQKIAQLKEENKDKLSAISEIRDESDKNGMRAVIKLKKDANAKAILDYLYKATGMQTTYGINMVAIADGKPKQMGLMEIISYYVEYQREVIFRRTKFELDQCKDRVHILEGLLIAIKNIDQVVKIIKTSKTTAEAKQRLRDKFNLSEKQAQAILDMRLARLVNLEVEKIEEELLELKKRIEELTKIYNSKRLQLGVVKEELTQIKKQYKNPRKSLITNSDDVVYEEVDESETFAKDVVVAVTANNTIKAIPQKNYQLAQKDITDTSTLNDVHTIILNAITTQNVLALTNYGNCFKIPVSSIQEAKWRDKGETLQALDKTFLPDESIVAMWVLDEGMLSNLELVFYTSQGMIKRTAFSEYFVSKSHFQGIKLKDGDKLLSVEVFDKSKSVLMLSQKGMVLNFETVDVPQTGRVTAGVKGMNIDDDDKIVFASQVLSSGALTVGSSNGYFKNVPVGEFEVMSRYRKGLRVYNTDQVGKIMLGYFGMVPPNIAIKSEGKVQKLSSRQISYDSRTGKGKQNIKQEIDGMFVYMS